MNQYDELEALYATLPKLKCQRKCQNYCGPILIPEIEHRRLTEKRGFVPVNDLVLGDFKFGKLFQWMKKDDMRALEPDHTMTCTMLMPLIGSCSVYGIRPLICRLWGMVDSPLLKCPFGCVPERWLSDADVKVLYQRVFEIQKKTPCNGVPLVLKGELHETLREIGIRQSRA